MKLLDVLIDYLDGLLIEQGKEQLLHQQQIGLILVSVYRFHSKQMLQFFLKLVQVIGHKELKEGQLQLLQQPLLTLVYVLQCMIKPMQLIL